MTKRSACNRTTPKPTATRGSAKDELGRYQEAIADYDEAIRLQPDDAEAYSNRGNAKAALGRYQEAPIMTKRSACNRTTPKPTAPGSAEGRVGAVPGGHRRL